MRNDTRWTFALMRFCNGTSLGCSSKLILENDEDEEEKVETTDDMQRALFCLAKLRSLSLAPFVGRVLATSNTEWLTAPRRRRLSIAIYIFIYTWMTYYKYIMDKHTPTSTEMLRNIRYCHATIIHASAWVACERLSSPAKLFITSVSVLLLLLLLYGRLWECVCV